MVSVVLTGSAVCNCNFSYEEGLCPSVGDSAGRLGVLWHSVTAGETVWGCGECGRPWRGTCSRLPLVSRGSLAVAMAVASQLLMASPSLNICL